LVLSLTPALPALRADRQAAVQSVVGLDEKIQLQQAELDRVAQQIDSLKREGPSGPFVPGELDDALRKSQVVANQLETLRTARSKESDRLTSANAALYHGLEQEIGEERSQAGAADDLSRRSALLESLKQLESERAQLAPQLSSSPELRLSGKPTDDPRELHERADALRDRADRLAHELATVNSRIQELRDEQDLDHELKTLSKDQGLFDEGDQRVRSYHSDALAAPAVAQNAAHLGAGATTVTTLPPTSPITQTTGGHTGTGQTIAGEGSMGPTNLSGTPSASLSSGAHVDGTPSPSATPAQVSEPKLGELVQVDALSTAALPDDASLASLVARKSALESERVKLEAQARRLDASAP
jgi:hypothetical protein